LISQGVPQLGASTLRWQKQVFIHTRLSRAYLALARLSCCQTYGQYENMIGAIRLTKRRMTVYSQAAGFSCLKYVASVHFCIRLL